MKINFLKIGGSVITDKNRPLTVKLDAIDAIAASVARYQKQSDCGLVIGNGGGSFGHYHASLYKQADGSVYTDYHAAIIHQSVTHLNDLVVQALLKNGITVMSLPAVSYLKFEGATLASTSKIIHGLLARGIVVSVYGDVAPASDGFRVVSTESLFVHIANHLKKHNELASCILATNVPGVLDDRSEVIPHLSSLDGNTDKAAFDVTGGMVSKVASAQELSKLFSSVRIVDGRRPTIVCEALNGAEHGTNVHSASSGRNKPRLYS
jgi:isopentenyl phosphate kinase